MCLFCKIIREDYSNKKLEDTILYQGNHFYTKPALGSFIEGYLLINSIQHVECLRNLSIKELNSLSLYIREEIEQLISLYNEEVVFFEHGSISKSCTKKGRCIGRCIPHAHMHLIPKNIFPIDFLKQKFNWTLIKDFASLKKIEFSSYLLFSNDINKIFVFEADETVRSQYLRKLVCSYTEKKDQWNWVFHPYRENIEKYIQKRKNAVEY